MVAQAEALTKQTSGVLVGQVGAGPSDDKVVVLHFSIKVPDLNDYRHRIMVVQHDKEMFYPAVIDAQVFRPSGALATIKALQGPSFSVLTGAEVKKPDNRADSDTEFIELVGKVLRSPYVISVAQSLIARAAEVRSGKKIEPFAPDIDPITPKQEPGITEGDTSTET